MVMSMFPSQLEGLDESVVEADLQDANKDVVDENDVVEVV